MTVFSDCVLFQEVQRNGKAGLPAGRWPSLLSLTCPRSSGSGSELSLSSACSEYSSGSHTWAEGRGSSKQVAFTHPSFIDKRLHKVQGLITWPFHVSMHVNMQSSTGWDKRLSGGSVSSNPATEQIDLRWKEGHILKGLKRLQMSSSKDSSSPASAQQCKDCMTSNEGIYSLGVKCGQQGSTAKQEAPSNAPFKASAGIAIMDFDDTDGEPSTEQSMKARDQTGKEFLCLEKLRVQRDEDNNVNVDNVILAEDSSHFPSPVTDNFLFLEGPKLKPGVSPTDSLNLLEEKSRDAEKYQPSGMRQSDRNNNQERSTDRKSRLDHIQRQQGRPTSTLVTNDVSSSIQHSATASLSCESMARQRSSSMEVQQCRKQAAHSGGENKNYAAAEFSPRKPKPEPCDSARKAFILRSKSADGGPEQKHTHSPLHQKLITGQRSQGQPNPSGQNSPIKSVSGTGGLSKGEKGEDIVVSPGSKSLKSVQKRSPLASPIKHSKTFKPPGFKDGLKSPTKVPLQITRHQSSGDSVDNSVYDNILCSPRKQRRQDHHCDASRSDLRSPSPPPPPPPPPGRTTSLLLRTNIDNLTKTMGQAQSSSTGKISCTTPLSSALQLQQLNQTKEHSAPKLAAEGKQLTDVAAKVYHSHSKIPSESQPSGSLQLSVDRVPTSHGEGVAAGFILPNQSILQRSQQSISEPKLSEVLPPTYSNVYYHGINHNLQSSISRAVKIPLPVNARSHEAISGQETSTFLVFRRQNKDDCNSASNGVQTYQTFTCEPAEMRERAAHDHTRRKIETRCNSLDSEALVPPAPSERDMVLDWGFDEEGWLFKRSVSVSTRPPLKPIMGMNGAKARSQSFGARYMDKPSFNRSGKVRTQIKTHSGSSLNSLSDVLPGSMSCSSSYHCPMNRSLLNNFLIEEGLVGPTPLGSSNERLQSLKHQREQARRLQIEQQFSSAFGEPVSEEPEQQSTITTIEEKVMLGIEENLQKTQEQERTIEVKQKPGSTLANWFGFRKSKLPAPSTKKADPAKLKEDKREQKITSLLGAKQTKSDKKRDRRKSDGKDW